MPCFFAFTTSFCGRSRAGPRRLRHLAGEQVVAALEAREVEVGDPPVDFESRHTERVAFGRQRKPAVRVGRLLGMEFELVAVIARAEHDRRQLALGEGALLEPVRAERGKPEGLAGDVSNMAQPAAPADRVFDEFPAVFVKHHVLDEEHRRQDGVAVR